MAVRPADHDGGEPCPGRCRRGMPRPHRRCARNWPPNGAGRRQRTDAAASLYASIFRTIVLVHPADVVAVQPLFAAATAPDVFCHRGSRPCYLAMSVPAAATGGTRSAAARACAQRQRRHPSVRRSMSDARAPVFDRVEHLAVRAGDVELGAALDALVAAEQRSALLVELRALRLGQRRLVFELRRPLKRRVGFERPDPLQVGLAPHGFQLRIVFRSR